LADQQRDGFAHRLLWRNGVNDTAFLREDGADLHRWFLRESKFGLGVFNISSPATPSLVGYFHPGSQFGENVAAAGNIVGLTDYNKILFFDVTNPTAPVEKGLTTTFKTGNEGFAISGNYAYVPDGDSLKIFDITNLMTPTLTAKISTGTGSYGYAAAVAESFCYVASEATGVRAIDISNPASPVEAGYYDGVPQSRGVAANGKYFHSFLSGRMQL